MESFPDELLLHVFSFLEDGLTLLDSVPLVCKRWHRVAQDPKAWASVRVEVDPSRRKNASGERKEEEQEVQGAARVILHAPFLSSVRIALRQIKRVHLDTYVFPSLRRCRAHIGELHLGMEAVRVTVESHKSVADVLALLWRCRQHLRVATLTDFFYSKDTNTNAAEAGQHLTHLRVLAGLQRLEDLRVTTNLLIHPEFDVPASQAVWPGLQLSRLRRLAMYISSDEMNNYCSWLYDEIDDDSILPLPVHLVRSCAAALRHLDLVLDARVTHYEVQMLSASLRPALAQCVSLRSVSVNDFTLGMSILGALHHAETLRLDVSSLHRIFLMDAFVRNLTAISEDLAQAEKPLRSIRSLDLYEDVSPYGWPGSTQQVLQRIIEFFADDVASLVANATSLRVSGRNSWVTLSVLPGMLAGLPALQDVSLGHCRVEVVPELLSLSDLRVVSGRVLASSPEELVKCEEKVQSFKLQRPHVRSDALLCELVEDKRERLWLHYDNCSWTFQ